MGEFSETGWTLNELVPSKYVPEKPKLTLGEVLQASFMWADTSEGFEYWCGMMDEFDTITSMEYIDAVVGIDSMARFRIANIKVGFSVFNDPELQVVYKRFQLLAKYRERFGTQMPLTLVKQLFSEVLV